MAPIRLTVQGARKDSSLLSGKVMFRSVTALVSSPLWLTVMDFTTPFSVLFALLSSVSAARLPTVTAQLSSMLGLSKL